MVLNFDTEIEILLHDQNKIVSYKELSNKFNLTPYEARKKLDKFISSKRDKENEKSNFHVTYLINGEEKSTKVKRVTLVNENELDKISREIKVLSKQVYSIQNNIIEDFNLIYTSDIDASNNIERKSNLNVIASESERKITIKEDPKPDIKPNVEALNKQAAKTLPQSISSSAISNINSNNAVPKSNILVDSVKSNIKKEDQPEKKATAKHDVTKKEEISETVNKKLKINDDQAEKEPTKPLIKPAAKKTEVKKAANQSTLTSFFKKN